MDLRDLNSLSRQRFVPVAFTADDIPPPPDEPHPDDIPVASPISTRTKASQHAAALTPIQPLDAHTLATITLRTTSHLPRSGTSRCLWLRHGAPGGAQPRRTMSMTSWRAKP